MRKKIFVIYGIVVVSGIIYFALIKLIGSGIPCVYRNTMGFLCPGCGSSDMLIALSELKIAQAFWCNPFVFLLVCIWTGVGIFYLVKNKMGLGDKRFLKGLTAFSVIASVAFAIARNLY